MEIAIKSDVGQRRTLNEDAAGYFLNTQNNIVNWMGWGRQLLQQ